MKKLILMILAVVMSTGCNLENLYDDAQDSYSDYNYGKMLQDKQIYYGDFGDVGKNYDPETAKLEDLEQVLEESAKWIKDNLVYKKREHPLIIIDWGDIIPNPKEIIESGYGSCRDFAMVLVDIVYVVTGIKLDVWFVDTTRMIDQGGKINHAEILYDEQGYSVYTGERVYGRYVGYRYSFDLIYGKSIE